MLYIYTVVEHAYLNFCVLKLHMNKILRASRPTEKEDKEEKSTYEALISVVIFYYSFFKPRSKLDNHKMKLRVILHDW